jgi:hypothetical protein
MLAYLKHDQPASYTTFQLLGLLAVAFILRAATFEWYLQHKGRYRQPDSFDYHYIAVGLKHDKGAVRLDNGQPLFWRTPGYSYFLKPFYTKKPTVQFETYQTEHKRALWLQIILCSLIPLLVFFLALQLTHVATIAWAAAWITALHPGFIFASGYLLTDALAHLIFTCFLIYFYRTFTLADTHDAPEPKNILFVLICAALLLGLYTWFRPIGRYFMFISCLLLALSTMPLIKKVTRILMFSATFFIVIAPWYIRNYQATGMYFFCPMSGPYLQTFMAPKIMRAAHGTPLLDALDKLNREAAEECMRQRKLYALTHPGKTYPQEFACHIVAQPWCNNHPFYFAREWLREVQKTTFDLYTTQYVAFTNNTFFYDPPEEFLSEKLADALYKAKIPVWMRVLVWLELLFMILLWIGLLAGCYYYVLIPCIAYIRGRRIPEAYSLMWDTWIKAGFFIAGMLIMTGGFGYARLRMPIDPLMFILSLTFWYGLWKSYMPRGEKNS